MMSVPFPDLQNDWLTIFFFFIVLLLPYLLGEKVAKIPIIGFAARKLQEGRHKRRRANVLTEAGLSELIEAKVDEKVGLIKSEVELLADYLAYDAAWHRRHDIIAGQEGWVIPPPKHLNLQEWLAENGLRWPQRTSRVKNTLEDDASDA